MATGDKDQTIVAPPPDQNQFERLTRAVETIAARAYLPTIIESRPLDDSAKEVAAEYGRIAGSLRTIFEPAPKPPTPTPAYPKTIGKPSTK